MAVTTPATPEVPIDTWQPAVEDRLIVDVKANQGYLVHENGYYTTFPVLTGQRRTVTYIGRTYNAATPIAQWVVKSSDIKGDHVTFGPTGLFLRLTRDGENTAYGIHGHKSFDQMLAEGNRYRSMGCILVSESTLKIVKKTFEGNGNVLEVATVNGLEIPEGEKGADISWLGL